MNDPAACKGLDPRLRGEDGREKTSPPSALRATSPRGRRSWDGKSSPFGGSTREAGVGGLFYKETKRPSPNPLQLEDG